MEHLQVYHCDHKERLGRMTDGGYVIAALESLYDLYIGCGIEEDTSFDEAFKEKHPDVYGFVFDGTIPKRPASLPERYAYVPVNVGGENTNSITNLVPFIRSSSNVFLKMDIEGSEWVWLTLLEDKDLVRMKQIVIELHWLSDDQYVYQFLKDKCLQRLAEYFYLVHVHPNNYGPVVNGVPQIVECTYVRKTEFAEPLTFNSIPFPTPLDFPNCPHLPNLVLDYPPFVVSS